MSSVELRAEGPESEGGVGDVVDLLAVGEGVEAVLEGFGVVASGHFVEVSDVEADAGDLAGVDVLAWTVGDAEASL